MLAVWRGGGGGGALRGVGGRGMWPLKASTPVSAAQGGSRCGKDAALWLTVGDGDGEGDGRRGGGGG